MPSQDLTQACLADLHSGINLICLCSISVEFETDLNLPIDAVVVEAFDILGEGGQICAVEGHECNECTKPFKQAGGEVVSDAAPVKMVVMDGIVMGPTVSGFPISLLYLC